MTGSASSVRVVAAILHETRRVLAVQRAGYDGWQPPSGDVARSESTIAAIRRHVRNATGFDILASGMVDRYVLDGRSLIVVRCRVRGVGSDIAPDIRAMRWLTRSDVLSQPRADWTPGLLAALADQRILTAPAPHAQRRVALVG